MGRSKETCPLSQGQVKYPRWRPVPVPGSGSDSPKVFSEFFFPNSVFIPGAVEQIYKFPTAIFSQPTFLMTFWTALFEKEIWKEQPPRLKCSKIPKIWKEESAQMSWVHFTRLLGLIWNYLKKILRVGILRRVRKIERLFLRANLILPLRQDGLAVSRMNADSQWNPDYKAFHRIRCCGNKTIRQQ